MPQPSQLEEGRSKGGEVTGAARVEGELERMDDTFRDIVSDLCDGGDPALTAGHSGPSGGVMGEHVRRALDWYREVLLYNVPHGKRNRGLTVVHCYQLLTSRPVTSDVTNGTTAPPPPPPDTSDVTNGATEPPPPQATSDVTMKAVRVLAWCVEILQAYFLVADDIMDQSETRRGQPCWYRKEQVGLMAVNDALFLESCIYQLLDKYFHQHPAYPHLLHLFHQTNSHTILGQTLDMLQPSSSCGSEESDIRKVYTEERYAAIAKYKTAYYSFYLPVALAMRLSGECSEAQLSSAQEILLLMGHYFQVQDDYLDCYGDVAVTGKVGTDIEEAKCSWLIVQAVQRASEEQINVLQTCYGRPSPESVSRVKAVYSDLGMKDVYERYEEECYGRLMAMIEEACSDHKHHSHTRPLPKSMFTHLANKIYKRQK